MTYFREHTPARRSTAANRAVWRSPEARLLVGFVVVAVIAIHLVTTYSTGVVDRITAAFSSPSGDVSSLVAEATMTDAAELLFLASRPSFDDRAIFTTGA